LPPTQLSRNLPSIEKERVSQKQQKAKVTQSAIHSAEKLRDKRKANFSIKKKTACNKNQTEVRVYEKGRKIA